MPAWITIYLQTAELALNSESVRAGIADADWWTLGESVGNVSASVRLGPEHGNRVS